MVYKKTVSLEIEGGEEESVNSGIIFPVLAIVRFFNSGSTKK
jgi:hypothetical protein